MMGVVGIVFQIRETMGKESFSKFVMARAIFEVKPKVARAILGGACQANPKNINEKTNFIWKLVIFGF